MRHLVFASFLSVLAFGYFTDAHAQDLPYPDTAQIEDQQMYDESSYADELARERYKTALARERAQQAYLKHQAEMYDYQRQRQNSDYRRAEQDREYDRRTNEISSVGMFANTVAGIVRQVQVLSGGRPGW
jgi:hypothetical protein